jgi:hypothetical protein
MHAACKRFANLRTFLTILFSFVFVTLTSCKSRFTPETADFQLRSDADAAQDANKPQRRNLQDIIESDWAGFDPQGKCRPRDLVWQESSGESRPCPVLMKGYILGNIHAPQVNSGYRTGIMLAIQMNLNSLDELRKLKALSLSNDQARLLGDVVSDLHGIYQINYGFQNRPQSKIEERVFGTDRIKEQFLPSLQSGLTAVASVNRLKVANYEFFILARTFELMREPVNTEGMKLSLEGSSKLVDLIIDRVMHDLQALPSDQLLMSKKIAEKFYRIFSSPESFKVSARYRRWLMMNSKDGASALGTGKRNTAQIESEMAPLFSQMASELEAFVLENPDASGRAVFIANTMLGIFSQNFSLIKTHSPLRMPMPDDAQD